MSASNSGIMRYNFSLFAGALIFSMCSNLTGSVLNDIMNDYNIPLSNGGLMSFFQYVGGIVAILVLSRVADRFKKPIILMGGFAVASAAIFLIGGFPMFVIFIVMYLVMGSALGVIDTLNNAVITDLHKGSMGSSLSLLHGLCGIGSMMIPLIAAIIGTSNWKFIYKSVALVVAILVVLQVTMYLSNKRGVDDCTETHPKHVAKASAKEFFSDKDIWLAAISMFFVGFGQNAVTTWGVKYGVNVFPDEGAISWAMIVSIYWIGATIARLAMGLVPSLKKADPKKALIIGCLIAAAALLLGIISGSYIGFIIGMLIFGLFTGASVPLIVGMTNSRYPKNTGLSSSVLFIALYIGFAVISILMGVVASAFGMSVIMLLPVIATVMYGVVLIPMSRQK